MGDLEGRLFQRQGNHFVPVDYGAQDMVESIPEGAQILLTSRRPRSGKNHAHFFAILNKAVEHLDTYQDVDDLLDAIKIAVGHTRTVVLAYSQNKKQEELAERIEAYLDRPGIDITARVMFKEMIDILRDDQRVIFLPKSINFASMPEDKFQRFKDRAMFVLTKLLGFDATDLLPEIERDNRRVRR